MEGLFTTKTVVSLTTNEDCSLPPCACESSLFGVTGNAITCLPILVVVYVNCDEKSCQLGMTKNKFKSTPEEEFPFLVKLHFNTIPDDEPCRHDLIINIYSVEGFVAR